MGVRIEKYDVTDSEIHLWIERDMPDGQIWADRHAMPLDVVAIRAGEFGMDPEIEWVDLWQIILNEVHAFGEIVASKGMTYLHPLYSASTLKEAREETLSICRGWQMRFGELENPEIIRELHFERAAWDSELVKLYRERTKQLVEAERSNRMNFHVLTTGDFLNRRKQTLLSAIHE